MPLFTYKCSDCAVIVEKLIVGEPDDLTCECGSKNITRQFGKISASRIWRGAQEHLDNVITPEVDRLQRDLGAGKDSVFLDIAGDE